jgi:amino acid permease
MDVRRGSSSSGAMRSNSVVAADADLARMGYKSELPRNLSMLSVLGLSFAIMAVPYGLSTTMYITLTDGQSVTVLWGWVLISLISTSIAASLAEICAVYPTAGGKIISKQYAEEHQLT